MTFYITLMILWFCYGAVCGSFAKLCADRIPLGQPVARGRSSCPSCGRMLGVWDLIPILSWVFLRGKCRSCGAGIGVSYPIAEAACGLLFCAAFYKSGVAPCTIPQSLFFAGLLAAFMIDLKAGIVPNKLNITLAVFAALYTAAQAVWAGAFAAFVLPRIAGAVIVPAAMLIIALVTKGFGMGDIKLLAAVGLFLGVRPTVFALALAFVLAGVCAAVLLIAKRATRKTKIPFAPFIAVSTVLINMALT